MTEFILPQWPLPGGVRSLITTRQGGFSAGPYESFNLASHVGDDPEAVRANRERLAEYLGKPVSWLQQTHSIKVVEAVAGADHVGCADAVITRKSGAACAVLTADCLPILLADQRGQQVAAVHAGWRGMADGIISETLKCFARPPGELMAYLGPAISAKNFEVGEDVIQAFASASQNRAFAEPISAAFQDLGTSPKDGQTKYLCDLYQLARSEMRGLGIAQIYGGYFCTFDEARFYSYRKDGVTGRMASLIWREN